MTVVRTVERRSRRKPVKARTPAQQEYLDSIDVNSITIALGPAGTGKTFLAVDRAVHALQAGTIQRLVITRPAVEAGENLGFLPGDLEEKLDPYMRPIMDAMQDLVGPEQLDEWRRQEVIEIAPLAFMRGRSLTDCFIIVDEAQNMSPAQIKMMLTRFGYGSKMVVSGDPAQVDVPASGLMDCAARLGRLESNDIGVVTFSDADVQRHPLVKRILSAYE